MSCVTGVGQACKLMHPGAVSSEVLLDGGVDLVRGEFTVSGAKRRTHYPFE